LRQSFKEYFILGCSQQDYITQNGLVYLTQWFDVSNSIFIRSR